MVCLQSIQFAPSHPPQKRHISTDIRQENSFVGSPNIISCFSSPAIWPLSSAYLLSCPGRSGTKRMSFSGYWVIETAGDQGRHTIPPEGTHRVLRYDLRLREFAREHQFKRLMHGRPSLVVTNEFRCLKYSLEQGMRHHIRHRTSW